jgi:ubiquinone/menaquinone biosynthesis C-methylase UbiE
MLARVLEPELMDSAEDAREYDAMDHAAVNAAFVGDLADALYVSRDTEALRSGALTILDLGAGTAQIPIAICRELPDVRIVAVDAAASMLALARENIAATGLVHRIELALADAKSLPFPSQSFDAVVSNSIVHHIAEPAQVVAEMVRVAAPGGVLFHRDLCRPQDESELERLVAAYAGGATPYQRQLFADSLRAALTLEETQQLVGEFGFASEMVQMTSDRHWTWAACNGGYR